MKNPNSVEFDSVMQHSNYEVIFMKTRKRLNADGRIQTMRLTHPNPTHYQLSLHRALEFLVQIIEYVESILEQSYLPSQNCSASPGSKQSDSQSQHLSGIGAQPRSY